jgi:hypothetical protein
MKKILFCICVVAMTSWITACKDDDKDEGPKVANEFTLENTKYALSSSFADSVGTQVVGDKTYHLWNVAMTSSGITYDNSKTAFTGTGDAIRFDLYTSQAGMIPEGTYTAGGEDNGIESALVFLGVNLSEGGGTVYDNEISDAEVIVTKSGSSHVFNFTITLEDARIIKGSFKGELTVVPDF